MSDDGAAFVRPFMVTGGRTEVEHTELRLDSMLSAVPGRAPAPRGVEHRAVLALCGHPTSIADLSATLDLPVGVVTVVVDDLLRAELVRVHDEPAGPVSVSVLERILDGVRAL